MLTKLKLKINKTELPKPKKIAKGAKYTPIAKRQERPGAIKWLLKEFPTISDNEICRLIRTTKNTVDSIRNKSHWNYENIVAKGNVKIIKKDVLLLIHQKTLLMQKKIYLKSL